METTGVLQTLLFMLVMCTITILPVILILAAVYFLRRMMTRPRSSNADVDPQGEGSPTPASEEMNE